MKLTITIETVNEEALSFPFHTLTKVIPNQISEKLWTLAVNCEDEGAFNIYDGNGNKIGKCTYEPNR